MMKLPGWKKLFGWEMIAEGLSDSEIARSPYDDNGNSLHRQTVKKLRDGLPKESLTQLQRLGASVTLLTHYDSVRAGRDAQAIPHRRPTDTYQRLRRRYWVPKDLIERMKDARDAGPELDASASYQERQDLYEKDRREFDRVCIGESWDATLIQVRGGYLIFGARTIHEFPPKLLKLFEKHSIRITEDSYKFESDLIRLVKLNK